MSSARRREADHILKLCLGDHLHAYQVVERQLSRAIQRAQVQVAVSGVVIAVTGVSGRAVAESGAFARIAISSSVLLLLLASLVAIWGVLRLRWLSKEIDDEPVVTLLRALEVRDRKALNLRWAVVIFLAGFSLYVLALAQLLVAAQPS